LNVIDDVIDMCHRLGEPARDLAVLAEGNASARVSAETFVVTASGSQLAGLVPTELVEMGLRAALHAGDGDGVTSTRDGLAMAVVDRHDAAEATPSIEAGLHAAVLDRTGAAFVGHTHPTTIVGLASSAARDVAFEGSMFPDEVVVCGPAYLVVPYASPGPALASRLATSLDEHRAAWGEWPRAVVLANHGLLALGESGAEVLAITTMAEKAARIRAVALNAGGLHPLPREEVDALLGRTDEQRRRRRLIDDER
jgi:rhamnose utilization protein RhaD (predicted bifunctional aldolase and dehydrogenase)